MAAENDETEKAIETLRRWIAEAPQGGVVFFGGAGVSTESGIPDFRSPSGLFAQKYPYPAEVMISRSFFDEHPPEFFDFYCDRMVFVDAKPNQAHRKLADLERKGIMRAVITQNIDGLHQAAGSKTVYELHGSVLRNFCMRCGKPHSVNELLALHEQAEDGVPHCAECRGIIKPDVVLYEEALDSHTLQASVEAIAKADTLIIAGTSLAVYPAATLIDYFTGDHLAIINRTPTPRDRQADLCIAANVGSVFDF
ncbi:NAD-dependent protein deacylase [Raoultibacter massiliensis]|uniref:protein acetyllysine N-acetyltransferase n=1 Tax=Raoultibacter massiliensis TaxID=1852371 RepID=A0ABV1JAD7_9ACTN|nr:NAD-dependent protein deacylase [Raoultibacter massiliensis]